MQTRSAKAVLKSNQHLVRGGSQSQLAFPCKQITRRYSDRNGRASVGKNEQPDPPQSTWSQLFSSLSKYGSPLSLQSKQTATGQNEIVSTPELTVAYNQNRQNALQQEYAQSKKEKSSLGGPSHNLQRATTARRNRQSFSAKRRERRRLKDKQTATKRPISKSSTTAGGKRDETGLKSNAKPKLRFRKCLSTRSLTRKHLSTPNVTSKQLPRPLISVKSGNTNSFGKKRSSETSQSLAESAAKITGEKSAENAQPDRAPKRSDIATRSIKSKATKRATRQAQVKSNIQSKGASELRLIPIPVEQPPVPSLAYGLERVLFNPGVYQLQDPRSRVYNFDPYLQQIMPVNEFDFNALKEYVTSSKDESLKDIARIHGKRYVGSTSSMTGVLAHFHYLLSQWRPVNTSMLSKTFPDKSTKFTELLRCPSAIFLKYKNGTYAIDADKQFDRANVLQLLGKSMEKFLLLNPEDYERYRKSTPNPVPKEERSAPESYHYSTMGDFLMRSQLDAHDARLPGTGMFDLKTRAVVSVRMDVMNYEHGMGYQIKDTQGAFESYEREYYDMIRAAFLKYSMQVRIGRMDGVFVAYHNTQRIFGFQYVSIEDMDFAVHGQRSTCLGDQEFALSIDLLNEVLNHATRSFPETSIRLHFETRDAATPFMYIFAEPVTDETMANIQSANKTIVDQFEKNILGPEKPKGVDERQVTDSQWEDMEASVQDSLHQDELGLDQNMEARVSQSAQVAQSKEDPPRAPDKSDYATKGGQYEAKPEDKVDILHTSHEEQSTGPELTPHQERSQQESKSTSIDDVDGAQNESTEKTSGSQETSPPSQKSFEIVSPVAESSTSAEHGIAAHKNTSDNGPELNSASLQQNEPSPKDEQTAQRRLPFDEKEKENFETQADDKFIDQIDHAPDNTGKVLAWTLTLRNKVNGAYILRPENLEQSDQWAIEYSLVEVPDDQRAWALYQACIARRKKKLDAVPEENAESVDYFVRNLRSMSQKGREWRQSVDQDDSVKPLHVLGQSTARNLDV